MFSSRLTDNNDIVSTDIRHLQETKVIVDSLNYCEINQQKNCQDIKANWMLLTQSASSL